MTTHKIRLLLRSVSLFLCVCAAEPVAETFRLARYCRDVVTAAELLYPGQQFVLRKEALARLAEHLELRMNFVQNALLTSSGPWSRYMVDLEVCGDGSTIN